MLLILPQNDEVWHRLISGVVLRGYIDGRLCVYKAESKDLHQPSLQQGERIRVRPFLTDFADQLALYKLQALMI